MLNVAHDKALIDTAKAKAAAWWALVCLLWILFILGICVLPAAVIAGWRWFL